jgi:hypothetical protein
MPEYNQQKARSYRVTRSGLKAPSSNWVDIECPFCGTESRAYVWSLSGGGKKCVNRKCGAMHTSYGDTIPLVGREEMEP